ncbi:MAG: protein kinase [Thermoanaerobaculia bacterium]|jgi:serine/threonine protein kinase
MNQTFVLNPGTPVSHYKILSRLGAGGMGEVYKARDVTLERDVAIKTLSPEFLMHVDRVRRFMQEARSASALNHPHIVTIYEIGQVAVPAEQTGGNAGEPDVTFHYIAMEFIDGQTMRQLIARGTDVRRLLEVMAQVCDGLAKAHGAGIVHRDLKPDNIMVTTDGYAKIVDFGLAKLTEKNTQSRDVDTTAAGIVMGTAAYMSPEQVQGLDIDHRSDIFSLGSILYEAVTNRRPFASESSIDTMHRIVFAEPQPVSTFLPGAPQALQTVLDRCLSKNVDERYQSTKEIANDLRGVVRYFDDLIEAGGTAAPASAHGGEAPREHQSPGSGHRAASRQTHSGGVAVPSSARGPASAPPGTVRTPSAGHQRPGSAPQGSARTPSGGSPRPASGASSRPPAGAAGPHLVDAVVGGAQEEAPAREKRRAKPKRSIDVVAIVYRSFLVILLVLAAWIWYTWPDFSRLKSEPESIPAIAALRNDGIAAEWHWVPYDDIAPALRRAVVELMDPDFYDETLSTDSVALALRGAKERKSIPALKGRVAGNSAITRGAVNAAMLNGGPLAKVQASAFAIGLEKKLSRREILVLYLNTARFSGNVFGVDAAAKHFFGKPAKALTVNESALLALALVDPDRIDAKNPDEAAIVRRDALAETIRGGKEPGAKEPGEKKSGTPSKKKPAVEQAPAATDSASAPAEQPASTETAPAPGNGA